MFNSLDQSPCDVGAALAGVCVGGGKWSNTVQNTPSWLSIDFTLPPLHPGYVYLGPDASNANSCRCSSVYYSLMAACSVCQSRNFIRQGNRKIPCCLISTCLLGGLCTQLTVPQYILRCKWSNSFKSHPSFHHPQVFRNLSQMASLSHITRTLMLRSASPECLQITEWQKLFFRPMICLISLPPKQLVGFFLSIL